MYKTYKINKYIINKIKREIFQKYNIINITYYYYNIIVYCNTSEDMYQLISLITI